MSIDKWTYESSKITEIKDPRVDSSINDQIVIENQYIINDYLHI